MATMPDHQMTAETSRPAAGRRIRDTIERLEDRALDWLLTTMLRMIGHKG